MELKTKQNIKIISASTLISFVILIALWYAITYNFFSMFTQYLLVLSVSLLIGLAIACSVRKRKFKAFNTAFEVLAIWAVIALIYEKIVLGTRSPELLGWGGTIIIMFIINLTIAILITIIINPLIRKFYLKEN